MTQEEDIECPDCGTLQIVHIDANEQLLETRCVKCESAIQVGYCNCCAAFDWDRSKSGRTHLTCGNCKTKMAMGQIIDRGISPSNAEQHVSSGQQDRSHFHTERTLYRTSDNNAADGLIDERLTEIIGKLEDFETSLKDLSERVNLAGSQPSTNDGLRSDLVQLSTRISQLISMTAQSGTSSINAIKGQVVQSAGLLMDDVKSNVEQVLTSVTDFRSSVRSKFFDLDRRIQDLPIGQLTETERTDLARLISDRVLPDLNRMNSDLSSKLLGTKTKKGPDGVDKTEFTHATVPAMFTKGLSGIKTTLAELASKLTRLEAKLSVVAGAATEALAVARPRGKNDPPGVTFSFNLAAIQEFVESCKQSSSVQLLQNLPDLFNHIEDDLKHREQESLIGHGDGANLAIIEVLRKIENSFVNWQRANKIIRIPEESGGQPEDRLHEITRTLSTDRLDRDRRIAAIDRHGYLFRNNDGEIVLQKAEVAVWDFVKK